MKWILTINTLKYQKKLAFNPMPLIINNAVAKKYIDAIKLIKNVFADTAEFFTP